VNVTAAIKVANPANAKTSIPGITAMDIMPTAARALEVPAPTHLFTALHDGKGGVIACVAASEKHSS